MTTDKGKGVNVYTKRVIYKIERTYFAYSKVVTHIVTPVKKNAENDNFTKALEAATNEFQCWEFQFQLASFRLNAVLRVLV